jgi:hypothetical protein
VHSAGTDNFFVAATYLIKQCAPSRQLNSSATIAASVHEALKSGVKLVAIGLGIEFHLSAGPLVWIYLAASVTKNVHKHRCLRTRLRTAAICRRLG